MKVIKMIALSIILIVLLSSCSDRVELDRKDGEYGDGVIESNNIESSIYTIKNGKIITDSFSFDIPEDYSIESIFSDVIMVSESGNETISVEYHPNENLSFEAYLDDIKNKCEPFGITTEEEEGLVVSGESAKKIKVSGLEQIGKNESMYCYFVKTSKGFVIISASLMNDIPQSIDNIDKVVSSMVIK